MKLIKKTFMIMLLCSTLFFVGFGPSTASAYCIVGYNCPGDPWYDPDPPTPANGDVTSVSITDSNGGSIQKGENIKISLSVRNTGESGSTVTFRPYISSSKYTDISNFALSTMSTYLTGGETDVISKIYSYYQISGSIHWAFNIGSFSVSKVGISTDSSSDTSYSGGGFTVNSPIAAKVLYTAVIADTNYLNNIGGYSGTDLSVFLNEGVTRTNLVHNYDSDYYSYYSNGLEALVSTEFRFLMVNNQWDDTGFTENCDGVTTAVSDQIGFDWQASVGDGETSDSNHGFDVAMVLSDNYSSAGNGEACNHNSIRASPNADKHLSQVAIVHEYGHLFMQSGEHCDSGSLSYSGYVMCSAQDNAQYWPDYFVWLDANDWNLSLTNKFN